MVNFDEIDEVVLKNFNGGDGQAIARLVNDGKVKIMKGILEKGCSIGMHTHETSCEVVYVISGTATCILNGKEETVQEGQVHYCPKGSTHMMVNRQEKPLVLLCIVPQQ